ncbi:MAG: 3'(2'),5'-bisphosphate nucleotidase CysQ [Rhizobiaceae bacterium]|nr:3'(2'),5'-bisphosphate nucleotidase CysQ [Rhizobiaceae bacterium]
MKHYNNLGDIEYKADNSPLTAADLEVDNLLFKELRTAFNDIEIITEERQETHRKLSQKATYFLIDPIDGTKEFINRRDEFTVNIGLIENGRPVLGAVCVPAKSVMYFGSEFEGAFKINFDLENNILSKPEIISPTKPDNDALSVVASRSHLCKDTQKFIEANQVGMLVNAGSSLKFCLLACGEADLYPRFGPTMEWDTAAGHAVLTAAGGIVENLEGEPLDYGKTDMKNGPFIAYTPGVEFRTT